MSFVLLQWQFGRFFEVLKKKKKEMKKEVDFFIKMCKKSFLSQFGV